MIASLSGTYYNPFHDEYETLQTHHGTGTQARMPYTHQADGQAYDPHQIHSQTKTPFKGNDMNTDPHGNGMNSYVVLYRIESIMTPLDSPFGFQCWAENTDHAEEQCINAYPEADIVWVALGGSMQDALDDYWDILEDCGL